MTEYHLWLDESGEFLKDNEKKKKNFRPSLIGGILFEKDKFSKYDATKIIKSDYFHSTECSENTDVFNKFKAIAESDVNLIEISKSRNWSRAENFRQIDRQNGGSHKLCIDLVSIPW